MGIGVVSYGVFYLFWLDISYNNGIDEEKKKKLGLEGVFDLDGEKKVGSK